MVISVIVCTHNPVEGYLRRALDALRAQTLPLAQWELLLVDNGSNETPVPVWDLSWHPNARHIREDKLGLSFARRRGVGEAQGDLVVFVDDDNVLAPDYLDQAKSIMQDASIGVLGGDMLSHRPKRQEGGVQPTTEIRTHSAERAMATRLFTASPDMHCRVKVCDRYVCRGTPVLCSAPVDQIFYEESRQGHDLQRGAFGGVRGGALVRRSLARAAGRSYRFPQCKGGKRSGSWQRALIFGRGKGGSGWLRRLRSSPA
jgi:hypothetical protein